jgi:hypothetical protein
VRWQQGVGAHVELTGARIATPVGAKGERNEFLTNLADGDHEIIPYYPGLRVARLGGVAQGTVDERRVVHPLAEGAEAYYTYELGDSVRYRLPTAAPCSCARSRCGRGRPVEHGGRLADVRHRVGAARAGGVPTRVAAPELDAARCRPATRGARARGATILKA